nr:hypothetical protein [Synergistaceae bacterium]
MSENKPAPEKKTAPVSRSVFYVSFILLAIGLIAGGLIGATATSKLEMKLQTLSSEIGKVREENASLRTALSGLGSDMGTLKTRFEKTEKENETLRNSLAALQKETAQ